MSRYRPRYTPEAAARVRSLHPEIKKVIREGIRTLLDDPLAGSALHFELSGFMSFRTRKYRIIYRLNHEESALEILYVGPRRDIYEEFRTLLMKERLSNK